MRIELGGVERLGLQLAFCVLDICLVQSTSRIPEVTHSTIGPAAVFCDVIESVNREPGNVPLRGGLCVENGVGPRSRVPSRECSCLSWHTLDDRHASRQLDSTW